MDRKSFIEGEGRIRVFPTEETSKCRDSGDCSQCGLCCIAFPIPSLPIYIPEDGGPIQLMDKDAFEPCFNLTLTVEGRLGCSAHTMKDHPHLRVCSEWTGDKDWIPGRKAYDSAVFASWNAINSFIDSVPGIEMFEVMLRKGIIPTGSAAIHMSLDRYLEVLNLALRCKRLPTTLLNELGVKRFSAKAKNELRSLLVLNWDQTNLTLNQQQFLAEFLQIES